MPLNPPKLTSAEYEELLQATASVPGWLNVSEQAILYGLGKATPGPILEMGCFKGKSTVCFLLARKKAANGTGPHVVVDLFKDHLDAGRGDFEGDFRANIGPFIDKAELKIFRMSTFDAGSVLREIAERAGGFAGIFVDADHSYESVVKDGQLAHEVLRPGGWVAFHDAIRWEGNTSVLPACLELPSIRNYGFVGTYASILLLQKPSAQESFPAWAGNSKVKAYAAWGKSPFAAIVGKGTGLIMGSSLGKFFSAGRRWVQRLKAPTA